MSFRPIVLLALLTTGIAAESADWPMVSGPTGNWLPTPSQSVLIEDFNLARVAWVSPPVLGKVRIGRTAIEAAKDGKPVDLPGSASGPIVAGAFVYVTTYEPSGDAVPKELADKPADASKAFRILANDQLVALDRATGEVRWTASEPGGINRAGGKRTWYGPSAACHEGTVYSLGTTGLLHAYDALTGAKRWSAPTPGHAGMIKKRDEAVAKGEIATGPKVLNSPVIAAGRVIVNDWLGTGDGLAAFDAVSGKPVWHVPNCSCEFATPTLARPGGRLVLLSYSESGVLTCIDPENGTILWRKDGLGPMICSLSPSDTTVMVNIRPQAGKSKLPGRWGAIRFDATQASLAWSLPDDPSYDWGWVLDSGARRKVIIRDGIVFITSIRSNGKNELRFLMLRESDGSVLVDGISNEGKLLSDYPVEGIPRLMEDRLVVAADEAHGASKTPVAFDQWRIGSTGITLLSKLWQPDLEPATSYEVPLEWPYADGRVYSRTADGRIACYDLRRPPGAIHRITLAAEQGFHGLGMHPLPIRLHETGGKLLGNAACYPPDDQQAGVDYGKDRRFPRWERADANGLIMAADGSAITGTLQVDHGTGVWPLGLDLRVSNGAWSGTWVRDIPGLPEPVAIAGNLEGRGPVTQRLLSTPWLADSPWSTRGELPSGHRSWVIRLIACLPKSNGVSDLTLSLDHDGTRFNRAIATAFSRNTAWHEVDASQLQLDGDRIQGRITLCLNPDRWVSLHPDGGSVGATIDLDLTSDGTALTGAWKGTLGTPVRWTGTVTGTTETLP